jgi:hypothetical protein
MSTGCVVFVVAVLTQRQIITSAVILIPHSSAATGTLNRLHIQTIPAQQRIIKMNQLRLIIHSPATTACFFFFHHLLPP